MEQTQKEIKDRITVVEHLYHQRHGEDPTQYGGNFCLQQETKEQPYERDLTATEEWKKVDFGWVESVGILYIQNREGKFLGVQPTAEARARVADKILEIAYVHKDSQECLPVNEVTPLTSVRCILTADTSVFVRSRSGSLKYAIAAFPR